MKPNLERYVVSGIELAWLEAYYTSLHAHIDAVQTAGHKIGVNIFNLSIHDKSKFDSEEFPHYARQFHGDAGDPDGFSRAWLHHIHHNPHHWQYWIFPDGYTPKGSSVENGVIEMPYAYALEMIADWMGASYVYTGSWDMQDWLYKNMPKITLHSKTAHFVRETLDALSYADTVYGQYFKHEMKVIA